MSANTFGRTLLLPSAIAAAVLLAACDGSSGSPDTGAATPRLSAQAVDGYLVGSSVHCDGVGSGGTAALGRFTCPVGTELYTIRGGRDVGWSEDETATGVPFVGELQAPSTLGWVTPLSTVAVALAADENGDIDPARFDAVVTELATVLGASDLDLDADASTTMELIRLNAQINELLSTFSRTTEEYGIATRTFASLVTDAAGRGESFDLGAGVDVVMRRVNTRLADRNEGTAKSVEELDAAIERVQRVNIAIGESADRDGISGAVVAAPPFAPAITIERDEAVLLYGERFALGFADVSLASFENPDLSGLGVLTVDGSLMPAYDTVFTRDTDRLFIGPAAFDVRTSMDAETVSLGFSLVATTRNDPRAVSVTTDEALLSTDAADDTMALILPAGAVLNVTSTDALGTRSTSSIVLKNEHAFDSANGSIDISFWRIDRRLEREGLADITGDSGNYELTAVIGGVRIGEREDGEVTRAAQRTVATKDQTVTGAGFRGYVSFDVFYDWY